MENFEKKLENLINCCCEENASNTPDFILAQYLDTCLRTFNTAVQQRESWYGRDPRPSADIECDVDDIGPDSPPPVGACA